MNFIEQLLQQVPYLNSPIMIKLIKSVIIITILWLLKLVEHVDTEKNNRFEISLPVEKDSKYNYCYTGNTNGWQVVVRRCTIHCYLPGIALCRYCHCT